MQKSHLNQLN